MSSTAITAAESKQLQTAINREHEFVRQSAKDMVQHALNCGNLLMQAKERVPHGGWAAWVDANFKGSEWVARKYMQLAREEQANRGRVTDMDSIRAALRSIASPRQQSSEPASPKLDPASDAGKMLGGARALARAGDENFGEERAIDAVVDADVVELPPTGVEERKWNNALRRVDDVRRYMSEAVRAELTSDATAAALQEASTAARQIAIDLEQMSAAARRRAA